MKITQMIWTVSFSAAVLLMNGCGGGDGTTSDTATSYDGVVVDAPVEGLAYRCGTIEEKTDAHGAFHCNALPVIFSVGGIDLGQVNHMPRDGYVTPQDMAGVSRTQFNNATVAKIALLLQSLDDDGQIEEYITLQQTLVNRLETHHLNISELSDAALIALLDQIDATYITSTDAALAHLQRQTTLIDPTVDTSLPDTTEEVIDEGIPDNTTDEQNNSVPSTGEVTIDEGTPESTTDEQDNTTLDDAVKQAYLDVINEARSEGRNCGDTYMPAVDPLTWSDMLYNASFEHSRDMVLSDIFSHTGSGTQYDETAQVLHPGVGSDTGERIEHNGYTDWRRYGENIAAGTVMDEATEAMEGWLESPGHCMNIMNADFAEVGMAVYYNEDSHYKYYWTQDFGTR